LLDRILVQYDKLLYHSMPIFPFEVLGSIIPNTIRWGGANRIQ
jgi:hypothetical protein